MKKIIRILLIVIILMTLFATISYGYGVKDLTGSQADLGDLKTTGNSIIKVISTIGVAVSVVALVALGIKYMMGSVEERAEYKKTLLPYVIGAILVFAASTIAQIIYDIAIKL